MEYVKNLFYNLFSFFKVFFNGRIYWRALQIKIVESNVHPQSKIYPPYNLSKVALDKGSYIGPNSIVSNCNIGKFCSIGPNFFCGWGIHPLHGISTSPVFYSTRRPVGFTFSITDKIEERKPISIGSDVFIGANVTILDGITIGHGAVIGANAVVTKDIPPYAIAVGNPIRVLRYRFDNVTIDKLLKMEWWNQSDAQLRDIEKKFFDVDSICDGY